MKNLMQLHCCQLCLNSEKLLGLFKRLKQNIKRKPRLKQSVQIHKINIQKYATEMHTRTNNLPVVYE